MNWSKYSEEDEKIYLENARVIYRMTKTRSPLIREYIEDPEDPDFIHVIIKKRKTGEWTGSSMIVYTHLKTWIDHDLHAGWTNNIEK